MPESALLKALREAKEQQGLRPLARFLEIDPGHLARVLAGRAKLSRNVERETRIRLGLARRLPFAGAGTATVSELRRMLDRLEHDAPDVYEALMALVTALVSSLDAPPPDDPGQSDANGTTKQ